MTKDDARAFATRWAGSWNSRDIEEVLGHFHEEVAFTSPTALAVMGTPTVRGKAALREYWATALSRLASLRFTVDRGHGRRMSRTPFAAALCLVVGGLTAIDVGAQPDGSNSPILVDLLAHLRPALERYYPGARSQVRGNVLEFEHDTRAFLIHMPLKTGEWQEAREVKGPNRGGILGTVELRDGRYDGAAVLPQRFNERYFETLVMAEPSPDQAQYLYVHLSYPDGVERRFLGDFHEAVRSAWSGRR